MHAPRPTGKTKIVNLAGKLFPWKDGQPVLIELEDWFIPIFSTPEQLEKEMRHTPYTSIKQITSDVSEFIESIKEAMLN